MAKIDLKKVAGEVLDAWKDPKHKETLEQHDLHYHDGHYRGGKCSYREELDKDDANIDGLKQTEEMEGAIYAGRRYEGKQLELGFNTEFGLGQKQGTRTQMFEPDQDGNSLFVVWCNADTPNSQFPADKLRSFFKKSGYELKKARAGIEKGKGGRDKDKKVLKFEIYRPENIQFAKENENDVGKTVTFSGSENLNERTKNQVMKKFGMKSDGKGKYVKRTADDNRKDKIRKYMGIVGDIEGQSNKEDVESGVWEKRRLASLKRAQDAKKREEAEGAA